MVAAPSLICRSPFALADRLKIQQETVRNKQMLIVGRLTGVVFEGQRSTKGLSQSKARYHNPYQAKHTSDALKPFSERQAELWSSITLDWLTHRNAPILAVSRDHQDLLLPRGLSRLPDIPDPRWQPKHAQQACPNHKDGCSGCVAPRIPQLLTGCPVVGDRVRDKITSREGRVYGVIHPITELAILVGGGSGNFARIRGGVDSDGT